MAALMPLALLAVATTANEFREENAMWRGAQMLVMRGVPLTHIDADQQWDGWHLYHWAREHPEAHLPVDQARDGWFIADYLPVIDREYIVGPDSVPGYKVSDTVFWKPWGGMSHIAVRVQKRWDAARPGGNKKYQVNISLR
jgi:hypothetical protein